jgi:nicotinamidase-related amidase
MGPSTGRNDVPAWISDWFARLEPLPLSSVTGDPATVAIFSADMVVGFCDSGNLASPRLDRLTEPVVDLFKWAWTLGVREFVLLQDTHDPNTPEFRTWPGHCLRGSAESQMIPELAALRFRNQYTIIPKNSIAPGHATNFDRWLDMHPGITTAIVVGNCTDLCTYSLAMHLRLRANARNLQDFDVVVPANAVDTYDLPIAGAPPEALPHPGDFFHQVFLYHMALNGIRVVRALT